VTDKFF